MRIYAPSRMQSVKDLPGQTKLKFRCVCLPAAAPSVPQAAALCGWCHMHCGCSLRVVPRALRLLGAWRCRPCWSSFPLMLRRWRTVMLPAAPLPLSL